MRSVFNLIHILFGALLLLGVVAAGGRPSAFPDTAFYYSQGEAVAARLGLVAEPRTGLDQSDPTSVLSDARTPHRTPLDTVLAARPADYGALLYGASRLGGLWVLVAVQALIASGLVFIAVAAVCGPGEVRAYYALMAGLAAATALPFLAGFAMPDLFAGLSALSAALLLVYGDRLERGPCLALAAVLAFGAACHPTHLIAAIAILALGLVLGQGRPGARKGAALTIFALAVSLVIAALVGQAASRPGHPQSSPPFLTARVLADGPGRLYLRKACADPSAFALCAYRKLPLDQSEDVLWDVTPRTGVFARADLDTRLALQREQGRFVIGAVLAHPAAELMAMAANAGRQLIAFQASDELRNASDFFRQPYLARTRLIVLIPDMAPCRPPLSACANRLPYDWLSVTHQTTILAALGLLIWRASRPGAFELYRAAPASDGARLARLTLLLIWAYAANAVVCGALSGPFARYGARMIWLIPLAAGLALAQGRGSPRPAANPAHAA